MAFKPLHPKASIEEGKMTVVKTKYLNVVLTQVAGKYYAFEDSCTHDGEEIACGKLDGCVVTCPRHFAQFDIRTGEVLALPATEPLQTFPVRISGDQIEVDLEGK
ncbi:non-heme iron oxygenase ferredoxin subunit [Leptospira sp. 96542]|nr:non-heme iron oxygenase ferredoxin subunit [Leptospira sp. 96542]